MSVILISLLQLASLVLVARALLSWVQPKEGGMLDGVKGSVGRVTEPVLAPVRRVVPRVGPLDLSALIVLLAINFLLIPVAAAI